MFYKPLLSRKFEEKSFLCCKKCYSVLVTSNNEYGFYTNFVKAFVNS